MKFTSVTFCLRINSLRIRIFLAIFLLFSIATFSLQAQTLIPDPVFEQALIDQGLDDVVDGQVSTAAVVGVTRLNVSSRGIRDLTGIEDFISLYYLSCSKNKLSSLDLSSNKALTQLYCYNNDLIDLDLSSNLLLEKLSCYNNDISLLNLNQLSFLSFLDCSRNLLVDIQLPQFAPLSNLKIWRNKLKYLNLSGFDELNFVLATKNPLECVKLSEMQIENNILTADIEPSVFCNSIDQVTNVPDVEFERYLIDQGWDDVIDGGVLMDNIRSVDKLLIDSEYAIQSLKGIESFVSLKSISYQYSGNLKEIDLSQNDSLEEIVLMACGVEKINLDGLIRLERLDLSINPLVSPLDLSTNTNLTELSVALTQLPEINLERNTKLELLDISVSEIVQVDLSGLRALNRFYFYDSKLVDLDLSFNNELKYVESDVNTLCVKVSQFQLDNRVSEWAIINYSLSCGEELTMIPDQNFEQALIEHGLDDKLDGHVLTNNISNIKKLKVSGYDIRDMTGIEDFLHLEFLSCSKNDISTLDVSNLTFLKYLYCYQNKISTLKFDYENEDLVFISCHSNRITDLILFDMPELKHLDVRKNNISNLNVSGNEHLTYLNMRVNPRLECVTVSESQLSNTSLDWFKDEQVGYSSVGCFTYVPDDSFEQSLIDLGYDDVMDNYVLTSSIDKVTRLNLLGKGIKDLTGIEKFVGLHTLVVVNNDVRVLDLSKNYALEVLGADGNARLEVFDFTSKLNEVSLNGTAIRELDFTGNPTLSYLGCASMSNLTKVEIGSSVLDFLDLGGCNLSSLDVSDANMLHYLATEGNANLTCIKVSQLQYDNLSNLFWQHDEFTSYSLDGCGNGTSVSSFRSIDSELRGETEVISLSVYPNPAIDQITISYKYWEDAKFQIFDIFGKTNLIASDFHNQEVVVNVSNLPDGLYILKVVSFQGVEKLRFKVGK